MSATSLLFAQSLSHFNSASDESDDDHLAICIIILLISVLEARAMKIRHRNINCLYLRWQDLLPNPREGTPWQVLWAGQLFGPEFSAWRSSIECRGDLVTNWGVGGDNVLVLCYSNGFADYEI